MMSTEMESVESLIAEHQLIKKQFRIAGTISLMLLLGGSWFYVLVEKFSWLNSIYFCTITLTTIGYGDLSPKTNAGKIFTIFYVLIGIGIIAFFANIMIKNAAVRRQLKNIKHKK
jgi:voltage-gated potassium channel